MHKQITIAILAGLLAFLGVTSIIPAATSPAQTATSPETELRGAWLWGRSCASPQKADALLDRAEAMHLNALFVLSFYWGATATHRSDILPMNDAVEKGFDPLGYLVEQGRRRGIEIHVWFVNGANRGRGSKPPWIIQRHPDWQAVSLSGVSADWFDLCQTEVQQWQKRIMLEVLEKYDVAGIHFDYIRLNGEGICGCDWCRRACKEATGVDIGELVYPALPAFGSFSGNPLAEPTTARVLARFDDDVPAVAENRVGSGTVVLLNWHAQHVSCRVVRTIFTGALESLGAQSGGEVFVLDSDVNAKKYGRRFYSDAFDLMRTLGFKPNRTTEDALSDLPHGAIIVLPNYYLMPDSAAQALLDHVRAGGGALFIDGPVMGMKSPAAQQLLGFSRSGRYFNGDRKMVATAEAPDWIPVSDRQIDEEAERARMEAWNRWRKDRITALVEEVSQAAKAAHPDRLVTAAVFSSETSADHVSQDWPRWVRREYLDYAIPMSYHVATDDLAEDFAWWQSIDSKLARIVPAVGITKICDALPAGERAARIAEQVVLCRSKGAHGVVMFSLEGIDEDTAREVGKTVFPEPARPWRPPPRSPER